MKTKRIGIVGAGFAGVTAAKSLAQSNSFEIDLIDRRNHHLFQPLLYQVAMAGLNPSDIAIPIRKLFTKHKNVNVILSEVQSVDVANATIEFDGRVKGYDYLILACGAKHFYFGQDQWEEFAPGLKTLEQATEIRRRVLTAFEQAEKADDVNIQAQYLNFVVVGAGPTGVELAGAIAEMAKKTLVHDFKNADLKKTKVTLVESGDRVLPAFNPVLSEKAKKYLEEMGVEVLTETMASELGKEGLLLNKTPYKCRTIIWAAGVKPASLTETMTSDKDRQGRVLVNADLSLAENKNVFVLGDQAQVKGEQLPGIAPVAIQQGQFLGKILKAELDGKPRSEFKYWDKGMMATIGRSKAVVSTNGINLTGFFAWLIWVFIHIVYIMRFKNRVFIFFQWIWSYFSFGSGARLIVQKTWRFYSGKKIDFE